MTVTPSSWKVSPGSVSPKSSPWRWRRDSCRPALRGISTLAFTVAQGNREGRGSDRLCYEGLLKRAIGGHWGMSGELGKMAVENKIEAYNCPKA